MPVLADMVESWHRPRRVAARKLAGTPREDRALFHILLACGLIFVGQLPRLVRAASFDASIPLDARIGGALLGWAVIAPLGFYLLAGLLRLGCRLGRGRGSAAATRTALFWAMLAAAPFWMLSGLASGLLGAGPAAALIGTAALAMTLWLVSRSVAEAEWPVAPASRVA